MFSLSRRAWWVRLLTATVIVFCSLGDVFSLQCFHQKFNNCIIFMSEAILLPSLLRQELSQSWGSCPFNWYEKNAQVYKMGMFLRLWTYHFSYSLWHFQIAEKSMMAILGWHHNGHLCYSQSCLLYYAKKVLVVHKKWG